MRRSWLPEAIWALAADLTSRKVAVIITTGGPLPRRPRLPAKTDGHGLKAPRSRLQVLRLAGDEQQWRAQRAHERRASGAQELRFALAKRGPNHHEIVDACSSRAADLDFWARMDYGQASYGD